MEKIGAKEAFVPLPEKEVVNDSVPPEKDLPSETVENISEEDIQSQTYCIMVDKSDSEEEPDEPDEPDDIEPTTINMVELYNSSEEEKK